MNDGHLRGAPGTSAGWPRPECKCGSGPFSGAVRNATGGSFAHRNPSHHCFGRAVNTGRVGVWSAGLTAQAGQRPGLRIQAIAPGPKRRAPWPWRHDSHRHKVSRRARVCAHGPVRALRLSQGRPPRCSQGHPSRGWGHMGQAPPPLAHCPGQMRALPWPGRQAR